MNFLPPLTDAARELVNYFRKNLKSADFKVARRQQWHKLVPIIDELSARVLKAEHGAAAYQFLTSGLFMAGTGQITEAQLAQTPALSNEQRNDCIRLARIYDRQRPRPMATEPPAPGQRITAKFKPDTYLGRHGSWHTGTIQTGPGGGFSIPGTGGIPLDEIIEWVPVLDETEEDVRKRQYWEEGAKK